MKRVIKISEKKSITIDQEMGKEDLSVLFEEICNHLDEALYSLKRLYKFAKERGFEDVESDAKDMISEFERSDSYPWTYSGKFKPHWESLEKQIDEVGKEVVEEEVDKETVDEEEVFI